MKKFLMAAALIFFASAAQAGVYVSGGVGVNVNSSDVKDGFDKFDYKNAPFYSAAVGYEMPVVPVRVELEGFYNKADAKHANDHMTTYALMANGFVRIPLVGLYGGLGLGYGSVWNKPATMGQAMVGIEYGLFGVNVGLEYRHIESLGDVKRFGDVKADYKADVLMAKVRFGF